MIIEDYVSFEIAKLLKEKGFDWELLSNAYLFKGNTYELAGKLIEADDDIIIPTQATAMKWLREVHKLHIWIAHKLKQNKGLPWYYEIHNIETGTVVKIGDVVCGSYEAACEAAIKYCLENLI